ncbi:hypothetical protein Tco_0333797, partial [Tanacetum coccineum]
MAATYVTHRMRQRTDALDVAGNTIASVGKAICSNKTKFSGDNYCGNLLRCDNCFARAFKICASGQQCEKCSLLCQR